MDKILNKIIGRLSGDGFMEEITEKLPGTSFNSLMLEIYRRRVERLTPAQVLKSFEQNRFVQPANTDAIKSLELQLYCLKLAASKGFEPITLSPLTPSGTCASVGPVNQNKIISSLRGTEVVSDPTNVMVLKMAKDFKSSTEQQQQKHYATVHRAVRAQYFDNPAFSAHFSLFCLSSGGLDRGSLAFELEQLNRHISIHLALLESYLPGKTVHLDFILNSEDSRIKSLLEQPGNSWSNQKFTVSMVPGNRYYQGLQFKIYVRINDEEINISDGGMVNWLQLTSGNRKLRAMISASGLELIQRINRQ